MMKNTDTPALFASTDARHGKRAQESAQITEAAKSRSRAPVGSNASRTTTAVVNPASSPSDHQVVKKNDKETGGGSGLLYKD